MTVHVHRLEGCGPAPLAHYLKSLAVHRLVAAQADSNARSWWKDDVFHLATELDEESLLAFFCERWTPTPIVSPWNGGSGFHDGDNTVAITAIKGSTSARLAAYRAAISQAQAQVERAPSLDTPDDKAALLAECFSSWSEEALAWLSAAVAPAVDKAAYPALLGTGGNDGRLDFSNNFMQRVLDLVDVEGHPRTAARTWLETALFGRTNPGLLADKAIGQFFPGAAGGANGTAGFMATSLINPWDFVFMLEGAVVLRVSALRKLDDADLAQASASFALRAATQGYGSAAPGDDSARGEQWMPLWSRPATQPEIDALFAEGRLMGGGRQAQNPLEAARAVARLGVARGITSFTRYGYLVRNGLSNLAIPIGTFQVGAKPKVRLLDEIDDWLLRYRRAAGGKTAPASFERAYRLVEGHALAVCQSASSRGDWEALITALGEAEQTLVGRRRATAEAHLQPLPRLSSGWFEAVADGSREMRIALAIASQRSAGHHHDFGPIRVHCMPLDPDSRYTRFTTGADGLRVDRRVVWTGRDLVADLVAVAERRAVEGRSEGAAVYPLAGREFATLDDVRVFVEGGIDEQRTASLVRAFMALDFSKPIGASRPSNPGHGLPLHALVRLAYLAESTGALEPHYDPTALRQLASGRLEDAVRTLSGRLVAMGVRPKLRVAAGDARFARRLGATAAIPISRRDLTTLESLVLKPFSDPSAAPPESL